MSRYPITLHPQGAIPQDVDLTVHMTPAETPVAPAEPALDCVALTPGEQVSLYAGNGGTISSLMVSVQECTCTIVWHVRILADPIEIGDAEFLIFSNAAIPDLDATEIPPALIGLPRHDSMRLNYGAGNANEGSEVYIIAGLNSLAVSGALAQAATAPAAGEFEATPYTVCGTAWSSPGETVTRDLFLLY